MTQKERVSLDKLKKKLNENSLYIGRVPPKAKERFKEMAVQNFNDDWGMTLMYLLDRYDDVRIMITLIERVNGLYDKLNEIESFVYSQTNKEEVQKKPKQIKTLGGKVLQGK